MDTSLDFFHDYSSHVSVEATFDSLEATFDNLEATFCELVPSPHMSLLSMR